jgi:hypothetical protein
MLRCGNIILLTLRFSDVAKFTNLTPLSLLISCKLSFQIVGLKMSSLRTLALKSPNRILVCYLGNLSNTRSNSSYKLSFTSSVLSSVEAWTFRIMIWHQGLHNVICHILSLTNSTPLTVDMILYEQKKKLRPIHDSRSPFRGKMYTVFPCRFGVVTFISSDLLNY